MTEIVEVYEKIYEYPIIGDASESVEPRDNPCWTVKYDSIKQGDKIMIDKGYTSQNEKVKNLIVTVTNSVYRCGKSGRVSSHITCFDSQNKYCILTKQHYFEKISDDSIVVPSPNFIRYNDLKQGEAIIVKNIVNSDLTVRTNELVIIQDVEILFDNWGNLELLINRNSESQIVIRSAPCYFEKDVE